MKAHYKIMGSVVMAAALAACGGGDGGSGGSQPGDSSNPGTESPQTPAPAPKELSTFMYYSSDYPGVREVKLDPEASSATVTLGSDTISYTYDAAKNSLSASGGYTMIGGLDGENPGAQVCKNGQSVHVILPSDAPAVTLQDLSNKKFTWYEDCKTEDGTGDFPSAVTFNSDGSATLLEGTQSTSVSATQISELFSQAGFKDETGITRLNAYRVGTDITIVYRQQDKKLIAAWTYSP